MPSLAEQQAAMRDYVLARTRRLVLGGSIEPATPWRGRERIHRNNCHYALGQALRHVYPVVERLVGAEFFAAMARAYIRQSPPASPVLDEYGADLPAFIEAFPPLLPLLYLADVARLELARHEVVFEAEAPPLPVDRLALLPPERLPALRLGVHPAHRVLRLRYPADAIWAAHQSGWEGDGRLPVETGRHDLLVARPRRAVKATRLGPGGADFLIALKSGRTIAEAWATALAGDGAFDLSACLRDLAAAEVFVAAPPVAPR